LALPAFLLSLAFLAALSFPFGCLVDGSSVVLLSAFGLSRRLVSISKNPTTRLAIKPFLFFDMRKIHQKVVVMAMRRFVMILR
jgi:hypothetical protein